MIHKALKKLSHKLSRKKNGGEEHENLERWMVSYADFVTLMFAFFVVMYAVAVVNKGDFKVLTDSISSSFSGAFTSMPSEKAKSPSNTQIPVKPDLKPKLVATKPLSPEEEKEAKEVLKRLAASKKIVANLFKAMEPLRKDGQVNINETDRGISIDISASSLFDSGSGTLRNDSIAAMQDVAKVLGQNSRQIEVEGHTDNVQINSPLYPSNWELSASRAASVIRLFSENSVAPERMVLVGYADIRPVVANDTPEGRARNRRVTILVLKEPRDQASSPQSTTKASP